MSTPFKYTLGQAAKHAKVAKSTLSRAVEKGDISVSERVGNGYRIDPAELDRWMASRRVELVGTVPADQPAPPVSNPLDGPIEALREIIAAERRRADSAEQDRDAWREQAQKLALTAEKRQSFWRRLVG